MKKGATVEVLPEIPMKVNGDDPKVKSKKYILRALKSQRKI